MTSNNDLLYSETQEWVKVDGDKVYVGITNFAQMHMGEIVFVELPVVGDEFKKGEAFCVIESVKAASEVYSPVTGKVTAFNEDLSDHPEKLNEDAFANWIIVMEMSDKSELDALMNEEAYQNTCE